MLFPSLPDGHLPPLGGRRVSSGSVTLNAFVVVVSTNNFINNDIIANDNIITDTVITTNDIITTDDDTLTTTTTRHYRDSTTNLFVYTLVCRLIEGLRDSRVDDSLQSVLESSCEVTFNVHLVVVLFQDRDVTVQIHHEDGSFLSVDERRRLINPAEELRGRDDATHRQERR